MNIETDKSAKDFLQLADGGVDGNPFPSLNNDGKLLFINDGFVTQFLYITPDELSSTTPIYIGKVSDENEYVAGELVGKNLIYQKIERLGHKNCGMGTFMIEANTIANIEDLPASSVSFGFDKRQYHINKLVGELNEAKLRIEIVETALKNRLKDKRSRFEICVDNATEQAKICRDTKCGSNDCIDILFNQYIEQAKKELAKEDSD